MSVYVHERRYDGTAEVWEHLCHAIFTATPTSHLLRSLCFICNLFIAHAQWHTWAMGWCAMRCSLANQTHFRKRGKWVWFGETNPSLSCGSGSGLRDYMRWWLKLTRKGTLSVAREYCIFLAYPSMLLNTFLLIVQGRSHQAWSDQVGSACTRKNAIPYEGLGACSPRKFRGYEIASETNFGPIRCFLEAKRQSLTWNAFLPVASAFWSSLLIGRKPNPSEVKLARLIVCLACKNGKLLEDLR